MTDRQLTREIIGAAIAAHRELGPGLLEAVYEECLCYERTSRSTAFKRQQSIPVVSKGPKLDCGYRADIVVSGRIIIEIKALSSIAPVPEAVILAYVRLSGCKIGLLIDFYVPVLNDGIKRYV
jgi:GxxExxY protein